MIPPASSPEIIPKLEQFWIRPQSKVPEDADFELSATIPPTIPFPLIEP